MMPTPSIANTTKEINCLALNIYFEARNQPFEGKTAVGFVTINRVKNESFPNTICEVVTEKNQFSWYWDGKPDTPYEKYWWEICIDIAKYVILNNDKDVTDGALYYHADYVSPYWAKHFKISKIIGNHIFYKE